MLYYFNLKLFVLHIIRNFIVWQTNTVTKVVMDIIHVEIVGQILSFKTFVMLNNTGLLLGKTEEVEGKGKETGPTLPSIGKKVHFIFS